eukprot:1025878-Rhodomonas_salina.2
MSAHTWDALRDVERGDDAAAVAVERRVERYLLAHHQPRDRVRAHPREPEQQNRHTQPHAVHLQHRRGPRHQEAQRHAQQRRAPERGERQAREREGEQRREDRHACEREVGPAERLRSREDRVSAPLIGGSMRVDEVGCGWMRLDDGWRRRREVPRRSRRRRGQCRRRRRTRPAIPRRT